MKTIFEPALVLTWPFLVMVALLALGLRRAAAERVIVTGLVAVVVDALVTWFVKPRWGELLLIQLSDLAIFAVLLAYACGLFGLKTQGDLPVRAWSRASSPARRVRLRASLLHTLAFAAAVMLLSCDSPALVSTTSWIGYGIAALSCAAVLIAAGASTPPTQRQWAIILGAVLLGLAAWVLPRRATEAQWGALVVGLFALVGYWRASSWRMVVGTLLGMAASGAVMELDTKVTTLGVRAIWSAAVFCLMIGWFFIDPQPGEERAGESPGPALAPAGAPAVATSAEKSSPARRKSRRK